MDITTIGMAVLGVILLWQQGRIYHLLRLNSSLQITIANGLANEGILKRRSKAASHQEEKDEEA
jgi:hypothetical protein